MDGPGPPRRMAGSSCRPPHGAAGGPDPPCLRRFPLIISAYLALSRFALAAGGFKLRFVGFLNFRKLLSARSSIISSAPSKPSARRRGSCSPSSSRRARRVCLATGGQLHRCRRPRPPIIDDASLRCCRCSSAPHRRRLARHARSPRCFTSSSASRAVPARPRPRLLCAQPIRGRSLLPRRLLRAADGDAGRHRLHVPHARRHAESALRADQPILGLGNVMGHQPWSARLIVLVARAGSGFPLCSS